MMLRGAPCPVASPQSSLGQRAHVSRVSRVSQGPSSLLVGKGSSHGSWTQFGRRPLITSAAAAQTGGGPCAYAQAVSAGSRRDKTPLARWVVNTPRIHRADGLTARAASGDNAESQGGWYNGTETDYVRSAVHTVNPLTPPDATTSGQPPPYAVLLKALDAPHVGRALKMIIAEESAKHIINALASPPQTNADGVPIPQAIHGRPSVYEFMIASLVAMQATVTKVLVHDLDARSTYHARVYYRLAGSDVEAHVDARPSDALNIALRAQCTNVYVHNNLMSMHGVDVQAEDERAAKSAESSASCHSKGIRNGNMHSHAAVTRQQHGNVSVTPSPPPQLRVNIKRAKARLKDRTAELQLRMDVATAEERYEDAAQIRDELDHVLMSDRSQSLLVALEAAAEDGRHNEAERLYEMLMKHLDVQA